LSILSGRYPFFKSPDDMTALAEIGALCGTREVQQVAAALGRKVTFPHHFSKWNLKTLCEK
jgi:cell division control protein 7